MRTLFAFLILGISFAAGPARAEAVINIYNSEIKLYSDQRGSSEPKKLQRDDIVFPAPVLSRTSSYGLIQVRFEMKSGDKKPLIGWIFRRVTKIDRKRTIDVPGCGSPGSTSLVVRAGRALGKGCKR